MKQLRVLFSLLVNRAVFLHVVGIDTPTIVGIIEFATYTNNAELV